MERGTRKVRVALWLAGGYMAIGFVVSVLALIKGTPENATLTGVAAVLGAMAPGVGAIAAAFSWGNRAEHGK